MNARFQVSRCACDAFNAVFDRETKEFHEILIPVAASAESFVKAFVQDVFKRSFGVGQQHFEAAELIVLVVVVVRLEKFEVLYVLSLQ